MLSAPAAIPATRQRDLQAGVHPGPARDLDVPGGQAPARSAAASAITGTRPARDTRFGSSNDACVRAGSCDNRTCEASSDSGLEASATPIVPAQQGTFRIDTPQMQTYLRGGSRLSCDVVTVELSCSPSVRALRPRMNLPSAPRPELRNPADRGEASWFSPAKVRILLPGDDSDSEQPGRPAEQGCLGPGPQQQRSVSGASESRVTTASSKRYSSRQVLRVNIGSEPPSLDPVLANDITSGSVIAALTDSSSQAWV